MSYAYNKLFSSITESTIWSEPHTTRIVWVSMMARMDRYGRVFASVPGLAHLSNVTIEECLEALHTLGEPDKWSRTPDNEGRRIVKIDGGWRLLNAVKYRDFRDEEYRRSKNAEYQSRHREKKRKYSLENSANSKGLRKGK
jgi:hypothetical protein